MSFNKGNISRQGVNSQSPRGREIVVFREGTKTETNYIDCLKRWCNLRYQIPPTPLKNEGIGDSFGLFANKCCRTFATTSQNKIKKISSVWFICDDDGRKDWNLMLNLNSKDFANKELRFAYSSMCIEYWILLHFRDHNGDIIHCTTDSDHSSRTIRLIDDEIKKYNKKNNDNIPFYAKDDWLKDNFDFFMAVNDANPLHFPTPKPRIVEAVVRARKIHEDKKNKRCEYTESVTTFYQFLEYLGVVYYKATDKADNKIYDVLIDDDNQLYYRKGGKKINVLLKDVEPFLNRR